MNILLVILIGLSLRLISLNQSLWLDEGTTGMVARMPASDILSKFIVNDFHPPLYYLFMRGWGLVFGTSEIALRAPSVLLSLATIYLVYKLVLLITNHKSLFTARLTALLLSTSGLFVYYSQEARMYMFSTFLVTLAFFSFMKTIKSPNRVGNWMLFSLSLATLSMSDYLPNFIILVFWVMAWKFKKNTIWLKKFIASHIIFLASWVWWLPSFLKQLSSGLNVSSNSPAWWSVLGKFSVKEIVLIPTKFIIGRVSVEPKWLYGLIFVWLFFVFGHFLYKAKNKSKIIWLWLILPTLLTILISIKVSVLSYFRLLFVLPAFYILISLGLTKLKKKQKKLAIAFVLCVNLLTTIYYLLHTPFHREDWRGLVKDAVDSSVVVVFPSKSQRETYLYYNKNLNLIDSQNLTGEDEKIWLVRYVWQISDPKDKARETVEALGYKKLSELDYNGVVVWEYIR